MTDRVRLLPLIIVVLPMLGLCDSVLPPGIQSSLNLRKVPDNSLSIYVENLDTGEPVLSWNEDVPRNPASVNALYVLSLPGSVSLGRVFSSRIPSASRIRFALAADSPTS